MTKQTNRKSGATAAVSATAPDAYTRITNRIAADLEQGVRPWCKLWGLPWTASPAE
jgi:antirestriction protein ArdC